MEQGADVYEPEAGILGHFSDYDDYDSRLLETETDYDHAVSQYKNTDPNKTKIMRAAEDFGCYPLRT